MAYSNDGLYQIGPGGNAPRMWVYTSADLFATVKAAGYFPIDSGLQARDVVLVIDTATPSANFSNVLADDPEINLGDGLVIPETDL